MHEQRKNAGRETGIAELFRRWRTQTTAMFAFGFVALFAFAQQLMVGLLAETQTQLLFDFTNNPWGAGLFVVGLAGFILLALALTLRAVHGSPRHLAGAFALFLAIAFVGGIVTWGIPLSPQSSIGTSPSTQLQGYIVAPTETGCSVNTITQVETCDLVYNYTSNYFAVSSSNASTCDWYSAACHPRNYIDIAVHEARVDKINATEGVFFGIGSIPTVTTTGATPTVYSPITGYIAATSSATGYWLVKQNAGSLNGLNPSEAAPGTTANLGSSTVGITAFGSVTDTWNVTLPGAGSSAAPASLYSALTLYGSYSETFTVSQASPQTYTLTVIVIGEHA